MPLSVNSPVKKTNYNLIIAILSLVLCLILNTFCPANPDLKVFQNWGFDMLKYGPYQFYSHAAGDATDYPPIYLLICGLMAALSNLFHADFGEQRFLFRLPSALILFVSIFVFNKLLKKFIKSEKTILILTFFYAFSPALIADVVWGQCDCFTSFYILLACLLFVNKKYFFTLLICTIGLLTKTQFLFVIPVFGFAVLWRSIKEKRLPLLFRDIVVCLLVYLGVFLPFILEKMINGQLLFLFQILFEQVRHFNRFSYNAFNLYTGLNLNFVIYPTWYFYVNVVIILSIVTLCCISIMKNDSDINIVLLSAFILTAIFMLLTNMHERYMLGALGSMMIAAYVLKNKLLLTSNWIFYVVQFLNIVFCGFSNGNGFDYNWVAIIFSLISMVAFVMMLVAVIKQTSSQENQKI